MNNNLKKSFLAGSIGISALAFVTCPGMGKEVYAEELNSMEHPQFSAYGIRGVTVIKDGEETFKISYEPEEYKMSFDCWEILNPYDETMTVDTEIMYDMFSNLSSFNFSAPLEDAEMIDTGLKESENYIIVDFVNNLNPEEVQKISDSDSQIIIKLGNNNGEGYQYASLEGYEENVYKISEILTESITEINPFDYILKIPVLVNNELLESINITIGDKEYEMTSEEETYCFNGKTVEKSKYTTLYQDILSIYLAEEIEKPKEESKEILKLCYNKKEDNGPDVEIVYSEYDEKYDLVTINDAFAFLVKADEVQTAIEKIEEAFK